MCACWQGFVTFGAGLKRLSNEFGLDEGWVCTCTSGLYYFLLSRHLTQTTCTCLLHADMQSDLHGQDNISDKSTIINLANLQANTVRKLKTSKFFHQYTPEQTNASQYMLLSKLRCVPINPSSTTTLLEVNIASTQAFYSWSLTPAPSAAWL